MNSNKLGPSSFNLQQKRLWRRLLTFILGVGLAVGAASAMHNGWSPQPALAQSVRPEFVAEIVYKNFPDLPKENQYIRIDSGEVDASHTLISRIVRYHQDVKRRPTRFRLDWKLTLADYLGVNEPVKEQTYPGKSTLTVNPMESDMEIVGTLSRRQRNDLVNLLASIYAPPAADSSNSESQPEPTPEPQPSPTPNNPSLSEPGDADLLRI